MIGDGRGKTSFHALFIGEAYLKNVLSFHQIPLLERFNSAYLKLLLIFLETIYKLLVVDGSFIKGSVVLEKLVDQY